MFSSQRYLLCSLVVHAAVFTAAILFTSALQLEAVHVHPIAVEEPAADPPDPYEPPQEEVDVEEPREDVELRDIQVIEIEPRGPSGPEPRRRLAPAPRPGQWLTRVLPPPAEEPPPEPVVAKPRTPPPVSRPPARPPATVEVIEGQNPAPTYPALAQRRGWEGDVLIDVQVDLQGKVLACAVATSSGFSMLDSAAATAVREWRFRNGPGNTRVRVSFVLGRL